MFFFAIFATNYCSVTLGHTNHCIFRGYNMATIHVFNPDHDMALAFGKANFTPPAAGKGMRADLGFLPAFWAADEDIVVVDDVSFATREAEVFKAYLPDVEFVSLKSLYPSLRKRGMDISNVLPWGWNMALRLQMLKAGVPKEAMPTLDVLHDIRLLSHRKESITMLQDLVDNVPQTVGERFEISSLDRLREWVDARGQSVIKAPWSGSGRGVRFVLTGLDAKLEGFVRNILVRQCSIIVEPYYHCVADFAMEFVSDGRGHVEYVGLSVFDTLHGAYTGNLLASEDVKQQRITAFVPKDVLLLTRSMLQSRLGAMCDGIYEGPIGVDMMVVCVDGKNFLHPCVEVNLRRTMGHVALSIAKRTHGDFSIMRVAFVDGIHRLLLE